jgi:K(+)-stimulated pyrophosphate-energized sodium pump
VLGLGLLKVLLGGIEGVSWLGLWGALASGLVAGLVIVWGTELYTSYEHGPVQRICEQTETGPATVIISGIAEGMRSTWIPLLTIVVAILLSFTLAGGGDVFLLGVLGVAIGAVGMLSTLSITLATDAYGPIADNAGGNAEMTHQEPYVRERTDKLDSLGNTTAATGKGFAIGSAALTALALFSAFTATAHVDLSLVRPMVMIGLLIGGFLPFLFSAWTMRAVGRAANEMVEEIRRQFREIPGILEGKTQPDAARCVAISTKGSLKQMLLPGAMAVAAPLIVGRFMGVEALGGLLAGALVSGVMMAIFMANAGGAWDNAKKYIEDGNEGGKGSDAHKAAVVGDTVGDPFKDTSGPSLNILIKLMTVVSLVFLPLF